MSTRLERLLESIDPERTLHDVSRRVDQAVNAFHIHRGSISKWTDFEETLGKFYCHVENIILRINRTCNHEMDWGRCSQLLNEEFGSSGFKAAFEIARTGAEGGLYSVLKAIARRMSEKYAQNEISARISDFWNKLSVDEKMAVISEYLDNYGHLLPTELTEGYAVRIRANFVKVLEEHPRIVQRLRRIGN